MAEDKIVAFMQDMAGKYIPGKRTGSDVLELFTTDTGRTYRVRVTPERWPDSFCVRRAFFASNS